ncbi:MAG: histidine kinase, partial [Gammaproteobacteria bacterium]|nr:histidine kinase [Gammaproteobacteria bacterium]
MPANLTLSSQQPQIDVPWKLLHLFNLYRLTLAIAFVALFFAGFGPAYLGKSAPGLYAATSIGYLGTVLANALLLYWRTVSGERQALLMVLVDILAIILIIHASGGIQTGLGALLAVSITFGSLIIAGPHAYLFASVSTLAVIGQQLFVHLSKGNIHTAYAQAAFLSTSFFAIALLTHVLAGRTLRIEKIASQRSLDL